MTTTGEMLVSAEWFDLIFKATRQRNEAARWWQLLVYRQA
jgi:hypothetical protein